MCVTELNVSTMDCRHRWYRLLRPCTSDTNLANCASKLVLEGWEVKASFCPFCAGWSEHDPMSYRLVGNDRMPSIGGLSRSSSMSTTSLTSARRDSRRGSLASSESSNSIQWATNFNVVAEVPITQLASERNKARNQRIDAYLLELPDT
ncbi:hypothetical protein K402DRAFT_312816, partial [Aulographum hederae CBS 113979]